jgi:hypothetical protein
MELIGILSRKSETGRGDDIRHGTVSLIFMKLIGVYKGESDKGNGHHVPPLCLLSHLQEAERSPLERIR